MFDWLVKIALGRRAKLITIVSMAGSVAAWAAGFERAAVLLGVVGVVVAALNLGRVWDEP